MDNENRVHLHNGILFCYYGNEIIKKTTQANGWSWKQSKCGNPDLERQMYYVSKNVSCLQKELYSKWPKLNLEQTPMSSTEPCLFLK